MNAEDKKRFEREVDSANRWMARSIATSRANQDLRAQLAKAKAQRDSARLDGMKEGVCRFAWRKDGVEYVGSCGTTLKKALAELEEETCPKTTEGA